MGILTSSEILKLLDEEELKFTPMIDSFQIQPHAIDLRLGFTFLTARHWQLNQQGRIALNVDHLAGGDNFDVIELEPGQVFDILPNEGVLVSTLETIKMPDNLVGFMYPRSSVNRRGLAIDLSGIIDAGYEGSLIIPVRNNNMSNVVRLYPGERFCQLTFDFLNGKAETRRSRYHKRDIASGLQPEQDSMEVELVQRGDIATLKEKYRVTSNRTDNE